MVVPSIAAPDHEELLAGFARIREQQDLPEAFPAAVLAAAEEAARRPPDGSGREDRRDLALVTIDPPGARDLDQAVLVERRPRGAGYRVWYAIADVAHLVDPGDPVDVEARQRVVTLYSPDLRTPLHPEVLGEGVGSLLPGEDRPVLLWQVDLDADGVQTDVTMGRAVVHSRTQLDYASVQADLDRGRADDVLVALRDVGRLREEQERARGGVSLNLPEQRVVAEDSRFRLEYRSPLSIEGWNAQISLLVGMAAAGIMVEGKIGLLRTLPPPGRETLHAVRRSARTLGLDWPDGMGYPEFVRSVDRTSAAGAALLHQAARALRGAGYVAFAGQPPVGDDARHSAIAAPYAHVTAPLRRLCDRFANEVVVALCAGDDPPGWATEALPSLPDAMAQARQREQTLSAAMLDFVEAMVLRDRVGEVFAATVTNIDERGAVIQIADPAVLGRLGEGVEVELGREVQVRLTAADPDAGQIRFELA